MEANSTPTAPAPTTISVFGISGSSMIERFVRMVLWSGSMPGRDFASEPLTIRMFAASIVVFLPSFSTPIFPGPSYLPQPCTHSTLFFLNRNSMPLACFLTILSFRAILKMIVNLRVVQEYFGGDAPDMQAGSAQKGILLNDDRLQPQFARPDRRHVSARAATDNRNIVFCHA